MKEIKFFFGHLKFKMTIQYLSMVIKWAAGKTNLKCGGKVRTGDKNFRVIAMTVF